MISVFKPTGNQKEFFFTLNLDNEEIICKGQYVLSCPVTILVPKVIRLTSLDDLEPQLTDLFKNTGFSFTYIVYTNNWCIIGRSMFSSTPVFYTLKGMSSCYMSFSYLELAKHTECAICSSNLKVITTGMSQIPFKKVYTCKRGETIKVSQTHPKKITLEKRITQNSMELCKNYFNTRKKLGQIVSETFEAGFKSGTNIGIFVSGGFDSAMIASQLSKLGFSITLIHWYFPEFPCTNERDYFSSLARYLNADTILVPITLKQYSDYYFNTEKLKKAPYNHMSLPWWALTLDAVRNHSLDYLISGRGAEGMYANNGPLLDKYSITSLKIFLELLETRMSIKEILKLHKEDSETYNSFLFKDTLNKEFSDFQYSEMMDFDNQDSCFKEVFNTECGDKFYNPLESEQIQNIFWSVPNIFKVGSRSGVKINKRIFREAFSDILPIEILERQQQPYLDIIPKNAIRNYGKKFRSIILNSENFNKYIPLTDLDLNQENMNKAYNSTIASVATARWLDGYFS